MRPFEEAKDDIIEIINEVFLFVILIYLYMMKNEEKWTKSSTGLFMNILTLNSVVVLITVICKYFISHKLVFLIKNVCKT